VFLAGNGGSAAITEHMACDLGKMAGLRCHALSSNSALVTALGNDLGYTSVFEEQVKRLGRKGDLLILVSSSGESLNVVKAALAAMTLKMKVLSLTGFDNENALTWVSDVSLHVPAKSYQIVEDLHQSILHSLALDLVTR
jgi:D-sedoheptulose 7-phosphate isomerase